MLFKFNKGQTVLFSADDPRTWGHDGVIETVNLANVDDYYTYAWSGDLELGDGILCAGVSRFNPLLYRLFADSNHCARHGFRRIGVAAHVLASKAEYELVVG